MSQPFSYEPKVDSSLDQGVPMVIELTRAVIIGAIRASGLAIPLDAQVTFEVPSGGDYSGEDVDLDNDKRIVKVRYRKYSQ